MDGRSLKSRRVRLVHCTTAVVLLVLFAVVAFTASRRKSPTFDETVHLYGGVAYLKWGDFRVNPEHPPLAKMWAAIPLLSMRLNTSATSSLERDLIQRNTSYAWMLANRFVYSDNDAETLFSYSRLMMISLALSLGVCVFLWARELYGLEAGVFALLLYCFDPNLIAHAAIVQSDVPFALFFFSATYFMWRVFTEVTWFNLLMTAVLFGAAAVTKFSFVALLPIWLLLGVWKSFSSERVLCRIGRAETLSTPLQKLIVLALVMVSASLAGYLAIWAIYQLRFDAVAYQIGQMNIVNLSSTANWLQYLTTFTREYCLLPEAWIVGISAAYASMDRVSYLLGEISHTGFWSYFPVAFFTKTPLPSLLLLLGTVLLTFVGHNIKDVYFLVIPAVLFFVIAMVSGLNLGLRHVLLIYPFLFVWIAGTMASLWRSSKIPCGKYLVVCCAVCLTGASLVTYPNYLAFFNAFAGQPERAFRILVDSNLDWGQDLKGLKRWMDENRVERIQLAYFGTAEPAYYGIDAVYLPGTVLPSSPTVSQLVVGDPPYVAISATHLAGLYLKDRNTYSAFREMKPVSIIGNSIWVFSLGGNTPAS